MDRLIAIREIAVGLRKSVIDPYVAEYKRPAQQQRRAGNENHYYKPLDLHAYKFIFTVSPQ
jgi:hypothetical protein